MQRSRVVGGRVALDGGRMRARNFTAAEAAEAERGGKLGVYNFQELNEQRKAWKMTHRRTDRQTDR